MMRRRKRLTPRELAKSKRRNTRLRRLALPISADRVLLFMQHLVAVPMGGEECWFYLGCKGATTLSFRANAYATVKYNGENVGPHQFALAASQGITLADLDGYDTHHASELGRCMGYRCCNPDHLQMRLRPEHWGTQGQQKTLNPRLARLVREVVEISLAQRRPPEREMVTGAGSRQRILAGMPFLIRLAEWQGIEESEMPESEVWTATTGI